jgi:hypothetical protein
MAFMFTIFINLSLLINVKGEYSSDDYYLPSHALKDIRTIGRFHFLLSFILFGNYLLGTALVNINSGFKWKQNVADNVVALEFLSFLGSGADALFEVLNAVIPDIGWTIFFLLSDIKTLYYLMFIIFSGLGLCTNPAYFCFHVLDIVMRISILGYVIRSVTMNIGQVLVTFLLGAVFMWIYSVIGVYSFGYNQYNYGDSPDYTWSESLANNFWQHLDYGLRGPPIFSSYADQAASKYVFDISYQIFIIVIMVAIITGIIIDTFSDLRAEKSEIENDQQNVCFVCAIGREVFERNRYRYYIFLLYQCN